MNTGDLGTRAAQSASSPKPWPWWAWLLTFLSYVALGYQFKTVFLNWIVGPLYPLFVMYVVPHLFRKLLRGST